MPEVVPFRLTHNMVHGMVSSHSDKYPIDYHIAAFSSN